jgi:hypothetical protein
MSFSSIRISREIRSMGVTGAVISQNKNVILRRELDGASRRLASLEG